MGYYQAGFEIVGVDIKPQPQYPFEFIEADAFDVFATIGGRFDVVHASPPCQAYSWGTRKGREEKWPMLIPELRDAFTEDTPYIIENIENAKHDMINPKMYCGTMFNLRLLKHRLFESNMNIVAPSHEKHTGKVLNGDYVTVAGHGGNSISGDYSIKAWQDAMGIDWMTTRPSLSEAIPPAYTKHIGLQARKLFRNVY
jgi:DNA (cytosine-5)-methyltransferase 1